MHNSVLKLTIFPHSDVQIT